MLSFVLLLLLFFPLMQNEQSVAENLINIVFNCVNLKHEKPMTKFSISFVCTTKAAMLPRK